MYEGLESVVDGGGGGGGGVYQTLRVIKVLALYSVINKAIFTKISIFQNLWALT